MDNRQADPKHKSENKLQAAELLALAAILLVGLSFRVSYLSEFVKSPDFTVPMTDAAYHDYWARGLASGDWTVPGNRNDPEIRSIPYVRPPGYPYFLALVYLLSGSSFLVARIVQMELGLVNCVLAYILGRSLFGSVVGLILAGLMSVYWAFIFFEGELLAPVLIIFCALCLINVLCLWTEKLTYPRSIAAGVLCGLFALVLPNVLLFVPVVLLWAWWLTRRRNDIRRFGVVAVGFLISITVVIAPVTLRNYLVADDFVLITSNAGINLYIGNNENSSCVSPSIPHLQQLTGMDKWGCFDYPEIVRGVSRIEGREMKHSEVSSYFTRKAVRYICENPLKFLSLTAKKALLFWGPAEVYNNKEISSAKQQSATLRYIPGFPVVLSSAVAGLLQLIFSLKRRKKNKSVDMEARRQLEASVLILLFIGTCFVSYLPFFIAARYRIPIIPFLLLFGAYGLYNIWQYVRDRNYHRAVFCVIAWVILYVLATRQIVPYIGDPARWYYYRASAYLSKQDIDLAIEEYRKALQVAPDSGWAHYYLARALERKGDLSEAAGYYYSALRIKPDLLTAKYNLGIVLYQQHKIDEAIGQWAEVIQLYPSRADAHNYLGLAFYKLGNINKAIKHWTLTLDLEPDWAEVHNNLAWIMATVEDEKLRNPAEAVRLAERAAELVGSESPDTLDTLSIAYAAAGRFKEAVQTAEKALNLAQYTGNEKLAKQIRRHLELFKAGQPFIEAHELPDEPGR